MHEYLRLHVHAKRVWLQAKPDGGEVTKAWRRDKLG